MAKNIIKEMIIILLLALAIILVLGVLLYKYVPSNKIIPKELSYTTPEKIKEELDTDSNIDDTQVIITYQIDSTDLSNYKKTQDYVPGKKNPFSSLITEESSNGNKEENVGQTTNSNQTSNNNQTTNESISSQNKIQDTKEETGYLPDKGTK